MKRPAEIGRRSITPALGVVALAALLLAGGAPALGNVCEGVEGTPGDVDGDGFTQAGDCHDGDAGIWAVLTEVEGLTLQKPGGAALLEWSPPVDTGTSRPIVYNVYRSGSPQFSSAEYGEVRR